MRTGHCDVCDRPGQQVKDYDEVTACVECQKIDPLNNGFTDQEWKDIVHMCERYYHATEWTQGDSSRLNAGRTQQGRDGLDEIDRCRALFLRMTHTLTSGREQPHG